MSTAASTVVAFFVVAMSDRALEPVVVCPEEEANDHKWEDNQQGLTHRLTAACSLGAVVTRAGGQGRVRGKAALAVARGGDGVTVVVARSSGVGGHGSLVDDTVVFVLVDMFCR